MSLALTTAKQYLGFTVGAGSGDQLEFTVHSEGKPARLVGRSGTQIVSATKVAGLVGFSGRLSFGTDTEVLRGPLDSVSRSIVVRTVTVMNPSAAAVDVSVYFREDEQPDPGNAPTIFRNRLWAFSLEPGETFTYTDGSGPVVSPAAAPGAPGGTTTPAYGVLTGSTNGRPVLVTSVTGVSTQLLHTIGGVAERLTVQVSANVPGPTALQLWIGGTTPGDGFEGTVGDRGPVTLLDRAVLETGVEVRVSAVTASVVTVMGGFERVVAP